MSARARRVLLGQLAANGDCLYATTIARQIKADDPDCHLTWAIGSRYRHVIDHNPHVDAVWEVPLAGQAAVPSAWRSFAREAKERQRRGEFDDVHLTQIYPDNFHNFDGTVRASIFRGYAGRITVPATPVVRLGDDEIGRAEEFARAHGLTAGGPVVLFECASFSGQSFVTGPWALAVARRIVRSVPGARVVLSSATPVDSGDAAIIDGSALRFRDNAALTRFCTLFMGCSSGITWLCTSDAARQLPMIQLLSRGAGMYGAVADDLAQWGLPDEHVIELHDCGEEAAARCAIDVLSEGVEAARSRHHEPCSLEMEGYYRRVLPLVLEGQLLALARSLRRTVDRYGARRVLITGPVSTATQVALRVARAGRSRLR